MEKSLGTNLHLWRFFFFTRAKRTARREFIYVCSAPPLLQCWTRVHAISQEVQHCMGGEGESNAF